MTKIFISYSHDSKEHRRHVLILSNRLRKDGLDCHIDQYQNGAPDVGWQRWVEKQIEFADFVLVVCTPLYLKRFKGEDNKDGRGVNLEAVIASQLLYDDFQKNTKFIPIIPDDGSLDNVPLTLKKGNTYKIGEEYEDLYRVLANQPRATAEPLGELKNYSLNNTTRIHSDRLPTVKGGFFGREAELQMLNQSWQPDSNINIIQFIAPGGTGKTKLLRHWLDCTDDIEILIAWSFYSQGTSKNKQTSATPFFTHIFDKLNAKKSKFVNDEEKGEYLADLLCEKRSVLVLDGLEPMQYGNEVNRGELKDRALCALLKCLAGRNKGLCVITTRIKVHELRGRGEHVTSHDLQNLALDDGVELLKSLGVSGRDAYIAKAVQDYGCHALALNLLGNAVARYLQGDILKRDTIDELSASAQDAEHASKVMQAYEYWLADTAELKLLYILGLFDHPIAPEILQILLKELGSKLNFKPTKSILSKFPLPYRNSTINNKEQLSWDSAIISLREDHHLLSQQNSSDELDCHPLIREHFGKQLKEYYPVVWQQAHETLYEYYRNLPDKDLPDTLEEMQPLFNAVAHGCAAGLHQQAFKEIYQPRIQRDKKFYLTDKIGAFSDDLATVAHFFNSPWQTPSPNLDDRDKASVLNTAGFQLRALGRLNEALEPMRAGLDLFVLHEKWENAASNASNLCGLQLALGNLHQAISSAELSAIYADKSGKIFEQVIKRASYANALHLSGKLSAAAELFHESEIIQHEIPNGKPRLNSMWIFRYCDLLLTQNSAEETLKRFKQWTEWGRAEGHSLLGRSLEGLILGRVHFKQRNFQKAKAELDSSITGLRASGHQYYLPLGLLARAALFRESQDFIHARQDLKEVLEISGPSGMLLHLTDYHLEMARLLLTERSDGWQLHVEAADELIKDTGYHRRDFELVELKSW